MYDEEMSSLNGRQSHRTISNKDVPAERTCAVTTEAGSAVTTPCANKNSGDAQCNAIEIGL